MDTEHRILSGRYVLEEKIGTGGMAEVFKARDKLLDRAVAVKILHAEYRADDEFIERFHREAQAAGRLSHPNIVNIYDVGADGNENYIVMEYVPSKTLKDKIREEGALDIKSAVSIAIDIANGLCHAHDNNIVHCDIKPHNILMTDDGHAKIADFGIARAVTESTLTYNSGNIVGSVHYFSPEQAQGIEITPKSDIYSLGVVMYEMLTNKLPFTADNAVAIAMKHVEEEPIPPKVFREEIPAMLEAVILRAMSKNPELRPNGVELVESLVNVQASFGTSRTQDPDATQFIPRVNKSATNTKKINDKIKPVPKLDVKPEPQKKSSSLKYLVAGILLFLLLGVGAGSFMAYGNLVGEDEVHVPDVKGKQMTLARQILESGNLRVNVAETYDAEVPAGAVVSQDPDAGRSVKSDRLVTIYVSKGGETIDMPDIVGLSKTAATERLQKIGLKVGTIYEKDSYNDPVDMVLSQDPAKDTKINRGQSVDLVVSKGGAVVAEKVSGSQPNYQSDPYTYDYKSDESAKTPSDNGGYYDTVSSKREDSTPVSSDEPEVFGNNENNVESHGNDNSNYNDGGNYSAPESEKYSAPEEVVAPSPESSGDKSR